MDNSNVIKPKHYHTCGIETIEAMRRIWGKEAVILFCHMNSFKYRMRAGKKDDANTDLAKAEYYESYAQKLEVGGAATDGDVYEYTRRVIRELGAIPQDRTHETD